MRARELHPQFLAPLASRGRFPRDQQLPLEIGDLPPQRRVLLSPLPPRRYHRVILLAPARALRQQSLQRGCRRAHHSLQPERPTLSLRRVLPRVQRQRNQAQRHYQREEAIFPIVEFP